MRWPALAAVLPVLPSPPTADAHIRSGVVATEYRVSVSPLPPALSPGVTARVYEGDRALGLTVAGDHSVIVLGYAGEPFLRIDSAGVAVNEASPTAVAVGFVDQRRRVRGPSWNAQSSEPAAAWHDRRLDGLRAGVERGRWAIPLVLDGEVVQLEGEIRRVPAPSPWPWVVVAGAFGVATALLLVARRPQLIRPAAVGFGALAAVATIATAVGFTADANASTGSWIEGANEIILALVGLVVLAWGSQDVRAVAAGLLGLLGIFVGITKLEVLTNGVVLSALPDAAARATVVVALSAGAAAMVVAAFAFESAGARRDQLPGEPNAEEVVG